MRKITALAAIAAMLISPAGATQWDALGPRAMGMGGAQVAIAQGPLASYWNPGGLGQLYNTDGLEIPFSARGEFTGSVLQGANDLFQLNKDCNPVPNPAKCTQANINAALSNLGQPNNGVLLDGGLGADIKIGKVVVFANSFLYAGATPKVDLTNTTPATINNNQSKLVLRGIEATEVGVGYGHEILETGLSIGATGKVIIGRVGYYQQNIVTDNPGSGSTFQNFDRSTKTSAQPGFDVGALWDMRETFPILPWRPRLGVVGRNLNNPKFDQPDAAQAAGEANRFRLNGQARAGAALSPFKFWNIAADLDLTDNLTVVDGVHSRYFSLGTEINIFNQPGLNIPLRVGIQKNVSTQGNSSLAYTAGFGFNLVHVMFDIGGMISAKTTTIQTQDGSRKIPNNAGASARFAFLFGGADEGTRNK